MSNKSEVTVFAVRGAVQLSEDSCQAMRTAVIELISQLCGLNLIQAETDIVSIHFTQTPDLCGANPARELRTIGYAATPLFCSAEPVYPDSLPRTVRVLMTYRAQRDHTPRPVYLRGAGVLRSDV